MLSDVDDVGDVAVDDGGGVMGMGGGMMGGGGRLGIWLNQTGGCVGVCVQCFL